VAVGRDCGTVVFPGALDDIVYTPGLSSTPLRIPRATFDFDEINLPISDGMIGLGGGNYLIQDMGRVHVAANVQSKSGDITFKDETIAPGEWFTWVFHVVHGDDKSAAAIADSLNAHPTLYR